MLQRSTPATGELNENSILAASAAPTAAPLLDAPDTDRKSARLRVVKGNERRYQRGRFNRYAPWGTAPVFLMFDVAGLVLAGLMVNASLIGISVLTAIVVTVLGIRGLYKAALSQSALNWLPELCLTLCSVLGIGALIHVAFDSSARPGVALAGMGIAIVAVTLGRMIANCIVWFARSNRLISHNVLILGAGDVGADLVATLRREPKYGLMPVGYYDPNPAIDVDMPSFDATQDIMTVIERLDAAAVIVAFSQMTDAMLVPVLRACDRMSCEIFVVPRLFELLPVDHREADRIGTTNLVRLRRATHRSNAWQLKRMFDIVASAFGLIAFAPLLLLAGLGSWKENGWPILFRQERVGLDGRRFEILKFQTMKPADESESATNWNISNDDRVGPIGRFLRKSSIDELPQLWNVLRGDMSLVGPRPERPHFVGQFSEEIEAYSDRHRVPSGLTGFAQVEGLRGDTSIEERARYDNAYVESWSLWTDIKILLRSTIAVVTRRGS